VNSAPDWLAWFVTIRSLRLHQIWSGTPEKAIVFALAKGLREAQAFGLCVGFEPTSRTSIAWSRRPYVVPKRATQRLSHGMPGICL
jgi:hypothetical protein